ncbi:hypothetical protein [Rhodococcus sp. 14-2483-1-2]|nr:hypothetical protein [Rhodococcus sp. 14-2483-1-2]
MLLQLQILLFIEQGLLLLLLRQSLQLTGCFAIHQRDVQQSVLDGAI